MVDSPPPLGGGRYTLKRILGQGGMAAVYSAHDSMLDCNRAIKVLNPALCNNDRLRDRFLAEARAMARLRHPNIVSVHDVGIEDGRIPYIIMEIVRGGNAMDLVERCGPQGAEVAGSVVLGILSGLTAAHGVGIIHRDIKPHNILLTLEGMPKITDFGIAHVDDKRTSMTKTGAVMGTLAYMSPEQRRSAKGLGPSTDVFACGATLYTMLTGDEPFDLYAKELQDDLLEHVPEHMCPIIIKACSYAAEERYQTALEMEEALRAALSEMDIEPRANGTVPLPELKDRGTIIYEDGESFLEPPQPPSGATAPSHETMSQWWTEGGERATSAWATEPEVRVARQWKMPVVIALMAFIGGVAGWKLMDPGSQAPIETAPVTAPEAAPDEAAPATEAAPEEASATPEPEPEPEPEAAPPVAAPAPPVVRAVETPSPPPAAAVAPPPPDPAPAPAADAKGMAILNSQPWPVDIVLNGESIGRGGKRKELPVGSYSVILKIGDGRTKSRTIRVQDGGTATFCWNFRDEKDC